MISGPLFRWRGWWFGIRFSFCAGWMGYHYSTGNRRLCIGLLPFVTAWVTKPGGKAP